MYLCFNLHEHIFLEDMSSSSRTSSNLFCAPNRSKESLVCVGDDVKDVEEAEDLAECPRDQTETVGEAAEYTEEAET